MKDLSKYREIAAQAWCTTKTGHIEMIPELAEEFAQILYRERNRKPTPRQRAEAVVNKFVNGPTGPTSIARLSYQTLIQLVERAIEADRRGEEVK